MAAPAKNAAPSPQGSALERLSNPAKIGLGATFVVLLGIIYFVLFYSDVDASITAAVAHHAGLEKQLADANVSQQAYQKDLDEKTVREQRAREQKKLMPDDAETPAFLSGIQGVATVSGVNLTAWSPVDHVPQEFFAKVPMKLSLSGKFHQVAKFFHGVGQLDRIINVEDIHIKAGKLEGDETQVQVECLATAFRAVTSSETPDPSAKAPKGGRK